MPPRSRVRGAAVGLVLGLTAVAPALTAVAAEAGPSLKAAPASAAANDDADRQAQLVAGEDERLGDVRIVGKNRLVTYPLRSYRVRTGGFYTLVLSARRAAYTFDDLRRLAPQTFLAQPDGTFLLREHILIDAGATLALAPDRPTTIRMTSGRDGFVSIVSRGGRLRLLGSAAAPLTLTSWDPAAGGPDTTVRDGRAYVQVQGQLVVRHTQIGHLGFWSGRTGGLALVGGLPPQLSTSAEAGPAAGSESSSVHRQTELLPAGALPAATTSDDQITGEISDSQIDGNAFGAFLTGVAGVSVRNVLIRDSLVHGLVLHRSVVSAQIDQLRVEHSGADGVLVTRGVEASVLSQVTSSGNAGDGVVIAGTPLATGPSPGGGSVRPFGNNVLNASLIENNGGAGVRVVGGHDVRIMGNSITGGHQGILVARAATGVVIEANRVVGASANGIQVRGAGPVEIAGNAVRATPTGIHIVDAEVTIADNTVAGATRHAVSLIGAVRNSSIRGNTLGGSGSSAIDVSRAGDGPRPDIRANDTGPWQRMITKDGLVSTLTHPLTLIWLVIAVLVGGSWLRRRRPTAAVPYLERPARSAAFAGISLDQQRAIEALNQPPAGPPVADPPHRAASSFAETRSAGINLGSGAHVVPTES